MKKYIGIIAVMALIAAGCAKQTEIENIVTDEEITPGVEMVEYTIMVGRNSDPATKARFTSSDDVKADFDWEVGDKIDVWDSNSGSFKTFTCTSYLIEGDDDARFSATLPAGTYTWTTAYYPSGVATDETHVTFPASYSDPEKVKPILVATYPASGDMYFKHLAAYVHFTVKNCPVIANKIVFSSDQVITGTYEVNAATQALSNGASTSNTVVITYPDWDNYTFTLPIIPGDDHTFSIAVQDATKTYFQVDGTADYDLPRRTVINMAELEILPDVYVVCDDWGHGTELAMTHLWDGTYALEGEVVPDDGYTIKFKVEYPTGEIVNYGRTVSGITDLSGDMARGGAYPVILENKGKYTFQFDFTNEFYWCGWSNPYYINYNDDDFSFDGWYGLEHICGNYYVWSSTPAQDEVRVYDLGSNYITDPIAVTAGVDNTVLVDLSRPSWSEVTADPYAAPGFVWATLVAGDGPEVTDDTGDWSDEIDDFGSSYDGFMCLYHLVLAAPTQLRIKEDCYNDLTNKWSYNYYGLSASGQTLVNDDVRDLVLHGNPFTLGAGTWMLYYHFRLHKVFIIKKV